MGLLIQEDYMNAKQLRKIALVGAAVLTVWLTVIHQLGAQVVSGDLVGTILDQTGAAVPGAKVEATKTDVAVSYETKANESGEYRFNNLPVGRYRVSASAPNFAASTVNGISVE